MRNLNLATLIRFLLGAVIFTLTVSRVSAQACTAGFTSSVNVPAKTVTFTNTSTSAGAGLTYYWNFGDGNYSSLASPTHLYTGNGTFIVSLTATRNDSSCYSFYSDTIQIGSPCNAGFYYTISASNSRTFHFFNTSSGTNPVYTWDFGDGTYSTSANPVHTYSSNGIYPVMLTVNNQDSSCFDAKVIFLSVSGSICNVVADFSYSPDSAYNVYNKLSFHNQSTGSNLWYYWNFGDGTGSTQASPDHTFPGPGSYTVCLSAINMMDSMCSDMICQTITITNPCSADFGYYTDSMNSNSGAYYFSSWNSQPGLTYYWNFGDGYYSSLANPSHQYAADGTYTVCLTISNPADSCYDYQCKMITVGQPNDSLCHVEFTYAIDTLDGTVYFNNLSTGGPGAQYHWNFGDGSTSTVPAPTHNYAFNGYYLVYLSMISADSSCQGLFWDTIYVNFSPVDTLCHAEFNYFADTLKGKVYFTNLSNGGLGTQYYWNFGDGSGSSAIHPIHQYAANGYYIVSLSMISADSSCQDLIWDTIYISTASSPDTLCNADFYYIQDSITPGTIHFINTSNGSNLIYSWSFGSATSTLANPSFNFPLIGIYMVTLTITNPVTGCSSTITKPVTVVPGPSCHAAFTYTYDAASSTYHFINLSTGPAPLTYLWLFGYGSTSTLENPSWAFVYPGVRHITLIVMSPGCSDSVGIDIYIPGNPACDATFNAYPDSMNPGTVYFHPANLDPLATYTWSFGDGTAMTSQSASHTYTSYGYYMVCLTVNNWNDSCSATQCDTVIIGGPTGIKEQSKASFSNIYPVPFNDELTLEVSSPGAAKGKITITDIAGKTLLEKDTMLHKDENTLSLDVKELPKGIYFLTLDSEYGISVKKISK